MPKRTVHFVTNRAPKGRGKRITGFGTRFGDGDAEDLRFGRITVDVPATTLKRFRVDADADDPADALRDAFGRKIARARLKVFEESILDDVGTEFEAGAEVVYGSIALFDELRTAMTAGRDVVVYVHGYDTSFRDAVADALTLQERLAAPDVKADSTRPDPAVVLFTWPSDGRKTPWISYRSDRVDASASGYALGRAMLKVRDYLMTLPGDDRCERGIDLLCHSMGNFVLQNAIERVSMYSPGTRLPRLFDQIFMVAADVDDTVFRDGRPLAALPDTCDRVHVYFNERDTALRISDATKANPERLGAGGASHPGELHQKIHQIDCSPWAFEADGLAGHGYHTARRLLRDVRVWIDGELEEPGLRRPAPKRGAWRI
jgi:esterase/lipase superfamily enzyme